MKLKPGDLIISTQKNPNQSIGLVLEETFQKKITDREKRRYYRLFIDEKILVEGADYIDYLVETKFLGVRRSSLAEGEK